MCEGRRCLFVPIGLSCLFLLVYCMYSDDVLFGFDIFNRKHIAHAQSASVWIVGSKTYFQSFLFIICLFSHACFFCMILTAPFYRDCCVRTLPARNGLFIPSHTFNWEIVIFLLLLLSLKVIRLSSRSFSLDSEYIFTYFKSFTFSLKKNCLYSSLSFDIVSYVD